MIGVISCIISVAAFAFSVYVFWNNRKSKKSTTIRKLVETVYYNDLFVEVPLNFTRLSLNNPQHTGIEEFINSIRQLLDRLKFLEIVAPSTYDDWTKKLWDIEDFVQDNEQKLKSNDQDQKNHLLGNLNDLLNSFYKSAIFEEYDEISK